MTMTDTYHETGPPVAWPEGLDLPDPGGAAPVLQVIGLTRRFGAITAVNDLTFEVRAGEVLGFLGSNGSGKSTTVSMILGLIPSTAGSVELYGHDVQKHPEVVARSAGAIMENWLAPRTRTSTAGSDER